MKRLIVAVSLATLLLVGCGEKPSDVKVEPILQIGNSLEFFALNDQFGKEYQLSSDTKKIIFAFEQKPAHSVNDYLVTKPASYLVDNNTVFVADVSAAPALIRNMFIMPGLKDFEHSVLIFEDSYSAAPFRYGVGEDSIVVVLLDNKEIINVENIIPTKEALSQFIEGK